MLALVTVLGVFVFPEFHHQLRQHEAFEKLKSAQDNIIYYDHDLVSRPSWDKTNWKKYFPPMRTKAAALTREWLGSNIFSPVIYLYLSDDSEESIGHVSSLRHLKWLQIGNPTGRLKGRVIPSLSPISNCTQLEYLAVGNWFHLTDDPQQLPEFRGNGTIILPYEISTDDITVISRLKLLRILAIGGPNVTDETIGPISELRNLEYLYLSRTNVTDDGVKLLREALPDLKISMLADHSYDYASEIQSLY
jgi:hypothetical protein